MTVKPRQTAFTVATFAAIFGACHFLPTDAQLAGTYAGTYAGDHGDLLELDAPLGGADLLADISTFGANGGGCKLSGSAHLATTRLQFTAADQPACKFFIGVGGGVISLPRHVPTACKQFCSGTASIEGRTFRRNED